jgi:hypothetical protein
MTNREIAQTLFVTVKAVQWHLRKSYCKLGIAGRGELPTALASAIPPGSPTRAPASEDTGAETSGPGTPRRRVS